MAEILLVSKPVSPPWNDSSKNLVRELASNMKRHRPTVMSRRGLEPALAAELPGSRVEAVYGPGSGAFTPALADNARVMGRLLTGRRADLWHFFFAPNRRSSRLAAFASRLRRARTVQTICSAPAADALLGSTLFAEVNVVLSRRTERRLLEAGLLPHSVRRIAPSVSPLQPLSPEQQGLARRRFGLPDGCPLVVYPGDLEIGGGADRAVDALGDLPRDLGAHLVMACRAKTPRASTHELRLRNLLGRAGLSNRVTWVGETGFMAELLGVADLVVLPSDDLYAKMDLPLVLLEAMSLGKAVLVAAGTSAEELAEGDAAVAVTPVREAVSGAIRSLLQDDEARRQTGLRAYDAVQTRFSPREMAEAYERVYDQLTVG